MKQSCDCRHGRGRPDPEAQADPEPERRLPPGEAKGLLRSTRGPLVPGSLLSPEPVPELHRGERGEAALLPQEVLTGWTLLHRLLLGPDVAGSKRRILNRFNHFSFILL